MHSLRSARMGFLLVGSTLALGACSAGDDRGAPAAAVITPEGADHRESSYSPDGSRMAYLAFGADGFDLWVADADGANGRRLASVGDLDFTPVWSQDGRWIAFASSMASLADIWLISADGGEPRQLTDGPGLEIPVSFHPDGTQLVYAASTQGGEINGFLLSLDDGAVRPLVDDQRLFGIFSPDGSKLALFPPGVGTIWVADADGTNMRQLTSEGFELIPQQPWSPDGTEIVYVSRRTGAGDVWAVPVDGGSPRQITKDVREEFDPAWSSDGEWITFIAERGRQTDVWVVPAAGGEPVRVTDDLDQESRPSFRPGTHTVSFHKSTSTSVLWVRSMADGSERQLTPDDQRAVAPDMAPDGSKVLYRVLRGGGVSDLYTISLDGGEPQAVTTGSGDNFDGQWSPDGSAIGFVSDRAGSQDVYVMGTGGEDPQRLTDFPENENALEWSHDSRTVYFWSDHEATQVGDIWRVSVDDGAVEQVTNTGTAQDVETSRTTPHVFIRQFGGAGQVVLAMLAENGRDLVTLYDRTSVVNLSHLAIAPSGDRLVALLEREGGAFGSAVITTEGDVQPILEGRESLGAWSPDGEQYAYFSQGSGAKRQEDLALYSFNDGSTVRLTETPEDESSARWTPDGSQLVFARGDYFERIVQVDMSEAVGR